jgi:hypothetical protein
MMPPCGITRASLVAFINSEARYKVLNGSHVITLYCPKQCLKQKCIIFEYLALHETLGPCIT